jgi:hypothetical protein
MAIGQVETDTGLLVRYCDDTSGATVAYACVTRNTSTQTSKLLFFDTNYASIAAQPGNSSQCGSIQRNESFVSGGERIVSSVIASGTTGVLGSFTSDLYRDLMVQVEENTLVQIEVITTTGTIDHSFIGSGSYHLHLRLAEGVIDTVEVTELDNNATRVIVNLTRVDSIT